MKILFVRHGESIDDIEDRYGGWADFDLTEKGTQQATNLAGNISLLKEKFEVILTSPLKRALQTAEIIGEQLKVDVEILAYLKKET